jgi:hypothetical protein
MESPDFNPIAMVRKEATAYFKDKNIETVLGDLEGDVFASFTGSLIK